MRSSYIPTRKSNACPICSDTSGKCRTIADSENVLCGNVTGDIPGWKDLGFVKKNPLWHTFTPSGGKINSLSWQERLELRNKRNEEEKAKEVDRRSQLKPIEQRDREAREAASKAGLKNSHRQELKRRGLTDQEIDYAVSQSWIYSGWFGGSTGFHISAVSLDRKIQGSQFARDDRAPKYQWVSKAGSVHLPTTGDNPLFIWKHPNFDPSKPANIEIDEGALKPKIHAWKYWRRTKDYQTVFVGAGSIPGEETVKSLISGFPGGINSIRLNPDAGWFTAKENVYKFWERFVKPIWANSTLLPLVNWWGQGLKPGKDVDELDGTEQIRTLTPSQFFALKKWYDLKKFTPDRKQTAEYINLEDCKAKNTALKAAMGAGKTYAASQLGVARQKADLPGILYISGSRRLNDNAAGEMEDAGLNNIAIMHKLDDRRFLRDKHANIFTCIDSVIHLKPSDFEGRLVIVDEAAYVHKQIAKGKTEIQNRREQTIEILKEGFALCDRVIFLDGTMSDINVEFWKGIAGSDFESVQFESTNPKRFPIRFLDTKNDDRFFQEVYGAARSGKKIMVASDSRADIEALDERLSGMGLKGYAFHSRSDEALSSEFFRDVVEFIERRQPEYIVISPSALNGVNADIDEYFGHKFVLWRGVDGLGIDDCLQIAKRLRDVKCPRTVHCAPQGMGGNNLKDVFDADEIRKAYAAYIEALATYATDEETVFAAKERLDHLVKEQVDRTAELDAIQNIERKNLRPFLLEAMIASGDLVEVIGDAPEQSKDDRKVHKSIKREIEIREVERVAKASKIDFKKAEELRSKEKLTDEERAELKRFNICDRLPGIEESPEWSNETPTTIDCGSTEDGEALEIQTTEKALFVDQLIDGKVIRRADGLFNLLNPEIPREIEREKWLEIMFGDRDLKAAKALPMNVATLVECGLNDVLESGSFFTHEGLEPLQGAGLERASNTFLSYINRKPSMPLNLDENSGLICVNSDVVKTFIQNCKKRKYRSRLGISVTNEKNILRDALSLIGLKLEFVKKIDGVRCYWIVMDVPVSIYQAVERKYMNILESMGVDAIALKAESSVDMALPSRNASKPRSKKAKNSEAIITPEIIDRFKAAYSEDEFLYFQMTFAIADKWEKEGKVNDADRLRREMIPILRLRERGENIRVSESDIARAKKWAKAPAIAAQEVA